MNIFINSNNYNKKVEISLSDDQIKIDTREIKQDKLKKAIKSILHKLIHYNMAFKNYKITEFEHTFTVGISKRIDEISNIIFCEFCGYASKSEEEVRIHRFFHGYSLI